MTQTITFPISRRSFVIGGAASIGSVLASLPASGTDQERPYFSMGLPEKYASEDAAFQAFCINDSTNRLYAQYARRVTPSEAIIVEYNLNPWQFSDPVSIQLPSIEIGHQGLSIQAERDNFYLWAAAPGHTLSAVRFRYIPNGDAQPENYLLFGDGYVPSALLTAVSYDGSLIIALARKRSRNRDINVLRIFKLAAVVSAPNRDASLLSKAEWEVPTWRGVPPQGLASVNNQIYISYGNSRANSHKPVLRYSLDGQLIEKFEMSLGRGSLAPGASYEPEGLAVARVSDALSLFIGLTTGRAETGRTRQIFLSRSIQA